jgi:rhodanese-related sulfurtransferase
MEGSRITIKDVEKDLPNLRLNCTILDVRDIDEFESGHIPGAKNIPLNELPERLSEIDKKKRVVTVCLSGGRASKAATLLETKGYNVKSMAEGMAKWQGPLEH